MALSIKTAVADDLARKLARLTGEAVTVALRDRLAREQARRAYDATLPIRLAKLSERLRGAYDTSPVTREEWNAASGDE